MSDTTLNQFVASGTAAERVAYTPTPPTPAAGPDNGYFFFETDTGLTYSWDGAIWVQTGGGGATSVTSAGTLTANAIVLGAGAKTVAALGSLGTTTTVLHGNAAGAPTFGAVSLTADVTGDLPFANLAQGTALSVLGVTGNATADNASIVAASDHQVMRRSGTAVAFGAVNLAQSAAVTGVLPVANGGTGSASGAGLLRATMTLTDAQYKALPTTGIDIIAAPGAGSIIFWQSAILIANFSAGAYTGASATLSYLSLGTGLGSSYIANVNTITPNLTYLTVFNNATEKSAVLLPWQDTAIETAQWGLLSGPANAYSGNNQPIKLKATNGGVDFGGGNAANTLKVVIYYTVETV